MHDVRQHGRFDLHDGVLVDQDLQGFLEAQEARALQAVLRHAE